MKTTILLLWCAAALPGCLEEDLAPAASEATSPLLSTVGVERIIPLHYYVLNCSVPTTAATIYEGVRIANRSWQSAGVQFNVSKIDRISAPTLTTITTMSRAYSNVFADLKKIDPTLTSTTFTDAASNEIWLRRVAERLDPREVPIIVPCTETPDASNGHACFPDQAHSHVLHLPPQSVGGPTLSHELGHYMGLIHSFETNARDVDFDQYIGVGGANTVFFNSPSEAASFRATGKKMIAKDGYQDGDATKPVACTYLDDVSCELQCVMNGRTYRTSTNPAEVRGLQSPVADAVHAYSSNIMSYLYCPGAANAELKELVPSQMIHVRNTLRSSVGDRNLLGRGSVQMGPRRSSTLDFDGDRKRDLAYFRPETSQCVVRRSRDGVEVKLSISGGDMAKGDQPVPADYDGDNLTDCAIFRPATATTSAEWRWTLSSKGGLITHIEKFGTRGDIPVSDVRMRVSTGVTPSTSGYGRYAIYRPSTGEVWWRDSTGAKVISFGGTTGDDLVFADYDRDGWTDPALWQPQLSSTWIQSQLKIAYSNSNYTSSRAFNFGLENDVPVGPVNRDSDPTTDFAVWRPSTGTWFYLLNPRADGTFGWFEQIWGEPGDAPMPGWDVDHDGRDDEAIWRIRGGSLEIWINNTSLPQVAFATGQPGDVPFFVPDTNGDLQPELYLYRPTGTPYANHLVHDSWNNNYPWFNWIPTSMVHNDIEL